MIAKRQLPAQGSTEEEPRPRCRSLQTLTRTVSPPPKQKRHKVRDTERSTNACSVQSQTISTKSTSASIEAGEQKISDKVAFYSTHLRLALRPPYQERACIDCNKWLDLYKKNSNSVFGRHFVVHQHDHPIAGIHYDLRLQCNSTSSISFAIMYGLPGDPNSRRLSRNATETRVHCLWNHLIETASHTTGSMLIWDTGEYEVLSRERRGALEDTSDESDDHLDDTAQPKIAMTEQEKLRQAFQNRKVKLRLHGSRLPRGYTLSLRLTRENDRHERPQMPNRRRRRKGTGLMAEVVQATDSEPEGGGSDNRQRPPRRGLSSLSRLATPPESHNSEVRLNDRVDQHPSSDGAASDEEKVIRANNAYAGATNDIGSAHQRKWYLSIDRAASGFMAKTQSSTSGLARISWERRSIVELPGSEKGRAPNGFERFVVGGRDVERSVVTGRLAGDILADEGVVGYIPRGLWRAVVE